jgi:galactokinase
MRSLIAWHLVALLSLPLAVTAQVETPDTAAQAEFDARTRRVESALARLQAEQQSAYQQFQMIQALRDGMLREMQQSTQVYTPEPTPPNYDDMIARRAEREERLNSYSGELDRLYARFKEIEDLKRPLLEELSALALER